jgi:hypothetical protein
MMPSGGTSGGKTQTGSSGPASTGGSSTGSGLSYVNPANVPYDLTESEEFIAEMVTIQLEGIIDMTQLLVPFADFIMSCNYQLEDCHNST